jgi:hypothetical protein
MRQHAGASVTLKSQSIHAYHDHNLALLHLSTSNGINTLNAYTCRPLQIEGGRLHIVELLKKHVLIYHHVILQ